MFARLLVLFLSINILHFGYACSKRKPGGWQLNNDSTYKDEMVTLAHQQLAANYNRFSQSIRIVSLETQVVAGINLRLVFVADEQQQCTLQAFKPLPLNEKSIETKYFKCDSITK